MMGVALDMAEPQQGDQRQILLHADPGPGREVLGRHEVAGAELGNARAFRIDARPLRFLLETPA